MTRAAALYDFFNRFMTFYPSSSIPDDVALPYGTYELVTSDFLAGEVSTTLNLWFYGESEAVPNKKVEEIRGAIGRGGVQIPCDDGLIWIKRGSPFSRSINNEIENMKQRTINLTLEFLTD